MPFADKVILISGASSGIGAACAEYFAEKGALLALVGRRAEKFGNVVEKMKENGIEVEPFIILGDVTVDGERIMSATIERYGHLDILINNAGCTINAPLANMNMEDFDAIMNTNVRGTFELTKFAVPHLIESKGNIVNISSALGTIPMPEMIAYGTSKAMLTQFSKCLSMELASKGVRVNTISPGVIDTEFHSVAGMSEDQYNEICEKYRQIHPVHRIGTTDDCVNAIAFVADDTAKFVTGLNLHVDGGLSIKGVF